jgi:glycosyltransferase involved in cell wall biosynthesis
MKSSDINIIPHLSNSHTNNTIPHKIFQILLSKQPLLVSDSTPLKRIINDNDAGFIHEASNPKSFANEVIHIYNNYELAKKKAMNGFNACTKGNLNWDTTGNELLDFYYNI